MTYKENDFVKVEYDMYANGVLVQTTNEKKGKDAKLQVKTYKPVNMILGKGFILKAFDEAIVTAKSGNGVIELDAEKAFGKRKKEFIRVMPKSAFDEQKLRAVVGMTYDFNGMFGTVKAVTGGRITIDFNNPLSGKNIKIEYKVLEKVEKIDLKLNVVLEDVLRIPSNMFLVESKEKEVLVKVPKQLFLMKDYLKKSFEELVPEVKDYNLTIDAMPEVKAK